MGMGTHTAKARARPVSSTQVMTLMVERNLPPEMSTYRAAINGSCDAGLLDVAVSPPHLRALRALRATGTPSVPCCGP